LVIASFSVLVKEGLYHYTMRAGRRIGSKMIQANAWHHRSDAISSIVVVVGVGGTIAGLPYLDTVAAVIVGVMIARVGWELGWPALEELMDSGLEEERLEKVKQIIRSVDGVDSIHMLRTRSIGGEIIVDVHVLVAPWMSVTEGHMISQTVMERLLVEVDEISDVTVHVDPEDDEEVPPTKDLPLRQQALKKLSLCWGSVPEAGKIDQTILHYQEGKIDIDLYLPLSCYQGEESLKQLRSRFKEQLEGENDFRNLKIFFG
jgi:divalent metal cation (Fe/Co/Zn/Cd) transporter